MPSYLQNGVFPEDMAMLTKKQQCSPQSGSHEFVWSGLTTRINNSSKNRISGGKKNEQKGGSTPVVLRHGPDGSFKKSASVSRTPLGGEKILHPESQTPRACTLGHELPRKIGVEGH